MPSSTLPVMPEMPARVLGAGVQHAHMLYSCLRYDWPIVQCCRCTVLCSQLSLVLCLLLMRKKKATELKDSP